MFTHAYLGISSRTKMSTQRILADRNKKRLKKNVTVGTQFSEYFRETPHFVVVTTKFGTGL